MLLAASILGASPWQGFTALVLSPDGRTFATGGRNGEVLWWETSTGELLWQGLRSGSGPVVGLAFDPDGTHLGVALLDGTLLVANSESRDLEALSPGIAAWKDLEGAKDRWTTSNVLSAGLRVAAGSLWARGSPDGQISVGTQADGRTLATWAAHEAAVTGLALASDGSFLLSCSYDGSLSRWDPATGRLLGSLQSPRP
jgi:WD40 repeat protein